MNRHPTPVLVVDENRDVREGLKILLEAEGWFVETIGDPRDALNKMTGGFTPCIILLDLMSSKMNGVEFHRELLDHPALQRVPLVAYSGLRDVRAKACRLVADESDDVPVEIDRLLAAVRQRCAA